jgi:hypothetical protein
MSGPNIYRYSAGAVQPTSGSNQTVGTAISTGFQNTTANPNLGGLEAMGKEFKEAVKATEAWHGSGGLGSTGPAGGIGKAAGVIAKIDDVTAVGNNLLAGKFLESAMEASGALAGPVGGGIGGYTATVLTGALSSFPAVRGLFVAAGIYFGDKYAGDLTKEFVYGEWVQATAPEIPANAGMLPAQTLNGYNYYVVSAPTANGVPRTFVYTDSGNSTGSDPLMFPNQPRYIPVVNQDISKQVVAQVLTEIGYDPTITLPQWNLMNGLSPTGYAINSTHYEDKGNALIVGTGPSAERIQNTVQVTTYKDPATGAIMEVRILGKQVDGNFQSDGTPPLTTSMDVAGRTVLAGDVVRAYAIAQTQPAETPNDGAQPDGAGGITVTAPAGNPYTTVSIQNHSNGAASYEFIREDGSHTWVLQNPKTGIRTVVLGDNQASGDEPRTTIYELSGHGIKLGPSRYYDGTGHQVEFDGTPLPGEPAQVPVAVENTPSYGTVVVINPSTTQVLTHSAATGQALRTTEVKHGDGNITRIVEDIDAATGRVLLERVYENTHGANPNNPNSFNIIGLFDPLTGVRQSINRETGLMEQLPGPAPTGFNAATALTDYTGSNGYVIKTGDSVGSVALKMGMGIDEFKSYLKEQYGETADLNNIVAGRSLPIPEDKLAAYKEASINGLDLDVPLNVIDIPLPDLVSHFTGVQNLGAYGAGQLAGLDVLPFNEDSSFLVNADGKITAEINHLPNGYYQVKDLGGNAVYVSEQNASVLTQDQYAQAQAQAQVLDTAQAVQAAGALGLINMVIGLRNWDQQSDLSHASTVIAIYNQMNALSDGALGNSTGLGSLGQLGAGLGFLAALESGNTGGMIVNGIGFADSVGLGASKAIAEAMGLADSATNGVIPGLGFALALNSGDPVSIASSGLSLMSSLGYIGPWGMVAGVVLSVIGGMFEDDAPDIPTREGLAHAQWDGAGNILVITDQDIEGGGPTATGWMTSMVDGLQAQLAHVHDAAGNPYALVPNLLPAIGFVFNPDGFNSGNGARGFVYLKWTDENGQTQTRYYDGAGNRSDGTGETLAGDFMQHAAGAIAPAWAVATTLAHYQQGQGIQLPQSEASLPQEAADGLHQTLQAITLALPQEPALQNALIDMDGDSYLERTQWLAANQQVLAVDADGNQQIGMDELLSLDGPASRHSLQWLDANNDQVLNDRDPAFPALLLWMDLHSDADSRGETQTMAQAGIVAIDFGSDAANGEWRLVA